MDLSATVAKHVGKSMATMNREMPAKQNTENITSLEALWISAISTTLWDGKWPTTHVSVRFLIRSDSRLACSLPCSPQPIFTSGTEKHFGLKWYKLGHFSLISSRGARSIRDLRISGLHDVLPSPVGLKHNGIRQRTVLV